MAKSEGDNHDIDLSPDWCVTIIILIIIIVIMIIIVIVIIIVIMIIIIIIDHPNTTYTQISC